MKDATAVTPLRKSNEVYKQLRRQIVLGELEAGLQLVELDLARRMGCSQSTVREALMRLHEDGLTVRQGYRGTVVTGVSAVEGQESLEIRARMEANAVPLAIGRYAPELVASLSALVRQMEVQAELGDEYTLFELDQEFHRMLYEVAGMPALLPILDRCSLFSHRYKITQSTTRRTLRETAQRHWSIVHAVLAGDAEALQKVLAHHVGSVVGEARDGEAAAQRLSPDMQRVSERLQREDGHLPNPMQIPLAQARINFDATNVRWNHVDDLDAAVEHFILPCPTHAMAAARITPRTGARPGTLLYLHGGGWVFGSVRTHLGAMARLAVDSGLTVVGVDYRLAPEAPFPAGLNDAAWAWQWLRAEAAAQGQTGPWFVSGDSAGANLALAMMLDLRHLGEPLPDAALLFYGVYSADHQTESHLRCGQGQFGLSSEKMAWYRDHYLSGQRRDPADPRVSPLLADIDALRGLPPLFLNAAGLDPLRDDTLLLARRLTQAQVHHELQVIEGVLHGFMQMGSELSEARAAFRDAAGFTRRW